MSGRILIADNVATNRIILKVKLSAASYGVIPATSAAEVLDALTSEQPDLIILDADLPDIDGTALCAHLRANPATADIPVIIVSGRLDPDMRITALRAGADDFLAKPLDEMVLLARVRNLIRSRALGAELKLREATATRLGFAEGKAGFARPERVLLAGHRPDVAAGWRRGMAGEISAQVEVMPYEHLLDMIGKSGRGPDLVVIPASPASGANGLILLAELRSRAQTRHAAIMVVHEPGDMASAVAALDMGADDVVAADCAGAEMAIRLRRQLDRKAEADRLRATVEDGLKLAMVDPLTGLFNRRYALPHLARLAERAVASGRPFAVMVLDIDRFKRVNDRYGHSAGDVVLQAVAQRIRDNLRSVDLVARFGGEEFLVAMVDTDIAAARLTAERLRDLVSRTPITLPGDAGRLHVTLSIGVAVGGVENRAGENVDMLIDCADHALMWSKSGGRNQVRIGQSAA